MADVNVTFGADTSALDAAITGIKAKTQNLVPGGPGSGILTPLPAGLGGPSQTPLLDAATAAAKRNKEANDQLSQSNQQLAASEREVGTAAEQSGINIGRMFERMATRLVIFGAIFESLRLLRETFQQAAEVQTLETRFESLTTESYKAGSSLNELQQVARESTTNITELIPVAMDLEKVGIAGQPAAQLIKNIAEYAHVAGEPVKELGDTVGRLAEHQASMTEMLNVAQLLGESTAKAVQAYHQRTIDAPILAAHEQRAAQLQERGYQEAERARSAQTSFLDKIGLSQQLFRAFTAPRELGQMPAQPLFLGRMTEMATQFWDQMQKGMEQLQQETGLTERELRAYFITGQLGEKDLLDAAHRRYEQEQIDIKNLKVDERYQREEAARQDLISLQAKELSALQTGVGLQEKYVNWQQTAAGESAKAAESIKELTQDSKELLEITTGWAKAIQAGVDWLGKAADHYNKWGERASRKFERWEEKNIAPEMWPMLNVGTGLSGQELQQLREKTEQNNKLMEEQNGLLRRAFIW